MPVLDVVGGVYEEFVDDRKIRRMLGSGLRASASLSSWGLAVRLVSPVDDLSREEAEAVADGYLVHLDPRDRSGPIAFRYRTGIASPRMHGFDGRRLPTVTIGGDVVLAFGLVEAPVHIDRYERLVVDPQHAQLGDGGVTWAGSGAVAVVLNERELRRLAAGESDSLTAARHIAETHDLSALIVKCGARGVRVHADGKHHWTPAIPTTSVAAVGTGDIFTAAFAHAWAVEGLTPAAAAQRACVATAWYAIHDSPQVPLTEIQGLIPPQGTAWGMWQSGTRARIYLAGPFFDIATQWLVDLVRDGARDIGIGVFSPIHDVDQGGSGEAIATADLDALGSCDAVLALLDTSDPGTLFEIGWATRHELPVVGYAADPDLDAWLMLRGSGATVLGDLSSALYAAAWKALAHSDQKADS